MNSWNEACAKYASDQGLDPITEALTAAGIEWEYYQSGGWTMIVEVAHPAGDRFIWLTDAHGYDDEGPGRALIATYLAGDEHYGDDPVDEGIVPISGVATAVRIMQGRTT